MSSSTRAWVAEARIGAVEALKDQGICKWNYALRSIQQNANNNIRSSFQANKISVPSSSALSKKLMRDAEKLKKSEESLRTVMYLSCWGPN
ncbi:uncharacterized protein LOC111302297 [Durio zibethinus]|uniref:Uncharacterized protein LOC111302297 n=1 Tax=Durio zibethinus TaxID=66656 RepID=A0A6P5ZN53_DURZI|nr:uncharacterized protein LOC111302297 [Durio zibethinus]